MVQVVRLVQKFCESSLLAEASFPCILDVGEKRPLPWGLPYDLTVSYPSNHDVC